MRGHAKGFTSPTQRRTAPAPPCIAWVAVACLSVFVGLSVLVAGCASGNPRESELPPIPRNGSYAPRPAGSTVEVIVDRRAAFPDSYLHLGYVECGVNPLLDASPREAAIVQAKVKARAMGGDAVRLVDTMILGEDTATTTGIDILLRSRYRFEVARAH